MLCVRNITNCLFQTTETSIYSLEASGGKAPNVNPLKSVSRCLSFFSVYHIRRFNNRTLSKQPKLKDERQKEEWVIAVLMTCFMQIANAYSRLFAYFNNNSSHWISGRLDKSYPLKPCSGSLVQNVKSVNQWAMTNILQKESWERNMKTRLEQLQLVIK